jgi:Glu-tRNA(Gln) amidotransferase subunit E-like FAD-binding protein
LDNIEKQIEQLKNKSPEIQKSIVLNIAFEIFANPNLEYKKVKSILDKIRKNVKNKEIIEIITTNELSWLLETPNNEKLNKNYINKLLNNLSEPIKKYYEALVANYYNDYQTYFKKLEEAALKNVKPAISKYIDLLYENLEKIENKKLLEKNFLKLSKALDNPGLM